VVKSRWGGTRRLLGKRWRLAVTADVWDITQRLTSILLHLPVVLMGNRIELILTKLSRSANGAPNPILAESRSPKKSAFAEVGCVGPKGANATG
jgi:hypothetical protein